MIVENLESQKTGVGSSLGLEWDARIEGVQGSTCYHLLAWREVGKKAYGLKAPYLIARDAPGEPIRGVLPLFIVRGPWQSHLSNGLFGAYGSIIADSEQTWHELLRKAMNILEEEGLMHFMLKCLHEMPRTNDPLMGRIGFQSLDSWVIARLTLHPDPGKVWESLRDKIRNCVRKAWRSGLEVRTGEEYLRDFYQVLAENMHQKGSPIYGLRFMEELMKAMGKRAQVITVWHQQKVVAGALLIQHQGTAYVPFASARPSALSMCPNNLLYWEIIRQSCVQGMHTLDFGRSLRGSGALAFKLGWGAITYEQPAFLFSTRTSTLQLDPKDRKLEWFVKQWRRLPAGLANCAGPVICRWAAGLL